MEIASRKVTALFTDTTTRPRLGPTRSILVLGIYTKRAASLTDANILFELNVAQTLH